MSRPEPLAVYSYSSTATDATAIDENGALLSPARSPKSGSLQKTAVGPVQTLVVPSLTYQPVPTSPTPGPTPVTTATPPRTPLTPRNVQWATHPSNATPATNVDVDVEADTDATDEKLALDLTETKGWTPVPMRVWFWMPFVLALIITGTGLEVALHFSNKNQGWGTFGAATTQYGFMHYAYTLPPTAIAAIFVALWLWTDIEIKRMQPYVDLVHGDSPPHRSLLLDYTRSNKFFVWMRALSNRHYLVALTSLMAIVVIAFQPLAAALFTVRETWWTIPETTVQSYQSISLNNETQFFASTAFVSAAGFAGASIQYGLPNPPFSLDGYTVAEFQIPTFVATNGTVVANTTAILSEPNCSPGLNLQMTPLDNESWLNSAQFNSCTFEWIVSKDALNLFGSEALNSTCTNTDSPAFGPIAFWFFTYQTLSPHASVTFCNPSISLWDVSVTLDIASNNITQVTQLAPFSASSPFSSLADNITGSPLDGQAFNGIGINGTTTDQTILGMVNATAMQLPAAVFQAAATSNQGLDATFDVNAFVPLVTQVYKTYLTLIARSAYFVQNTAPMTVEVKTFRLRLWLSAPAVHLLATGLFMLAIFGTFINVFHSFERRDLVLAHTPGTIASAVSIGAKTGLGDLLDSGRFGEEDLKKRLGDKLFRFDPVMNKIYMEGEDGYEDIRSPGPRRSVFDTMLNPGRPISRRFSTATAGAGRRSPLAPDTPRSSSSSAQIPALPHTPRSANLPPSPLSPRPPASP